MKRVQYCVSVTRGRRTVYKWGDRLKDAVALLRLKRGEVFEYVRYEHGGATLATFHGNSYGPA